MLLAARNRLLGMLVRTHHYMGAYEDACYACGRIPTIKLYVGKYFLCHLCRNATVDDVDEDLKYIKEYPNMIAKAYRYDISMIMLSNIQRKLYTIANTCMLCFDIKYDYGYKCNDNFICELCMNIVNLRYTAVMFANMVMDRSIVVSDAAKYVKRYIWELYLRHHI